MDSLAGTKILAGLFTAVLIATAGCGEPAKLPLSATVGSDPVIPPPEKTMIPTLHIATAKGWPDGGRPAPAVGTEVAAFATGLEHPRWLYTLPNGDVLVAETKAPPAPEDFKGVKGRITKMMMKRAGSGGPSANRISLLRDADGDGVVEHRAVFLEGLN